MSNGNELKGSIAQDIDECLFNSVKQHVKFTPQIANVLELGWSVDDLPTYEQVCNLGGTHKAYANFPGYYEINDFLRVNPQFNTHLAEIEGAKDTIVALQELELFDFYLTTRPASLAQATFEQLVEAGFPKSEVIARPDAVPLSQTSAWKHTVLSQKLQETGRKKIMIDDSLSMRGYIKSASERGIQGVLFDGPLTPKDNGAMNWAEILELLSNTKDWNTLAGELSKK